MVLWAQWFHEAVMEKCSAQALVCTHSVHVSAWKGENYSRTGFEGNNAEYFSCSAPETGADVLRFWMSTEPHLHVRRSSTSIDLRSNQWYVWSTLVYYSYVLSVGVHRHTNLTLMLIEIMSNILFLVDFSLGDDVKRRMITSANHRHSLNHITNSH